MKSQFIASFMCLAFLSVNGPSAIKMRLEQTFLAVTYSNL